SRPLPPVVTQNAPGPQNYAPNAPNPPAALYPPPTPAPMPPANVARRMQAKARKPAGQGMPMIGVLLGALIGCGLLTAVVIAVALAANSFLGADNQPNTSLTEQALTAEGAQSAGGEEEATPSPEEEDTDEAETPNVQDVDGTLYQLPLDNT